MEDVKLKKYIDCILQKILNVANPTKVILFGSAAHGKMKKNSDIDLLVVIKTGLHRRKMAQIIYKNMIGVGFAADIVVVTEEDINRYKNNPYMVIKYAMDEGKVIYGAQFE